jgi:hypothetical protein
MLGTKANSHCHRHNDRGSFVLEFDGDSYAADSGGQNYADIDTKNVVRADYHNMLVPNRQLSNFAGAPERPLSLDYPVALETSALGTGAGAQA